MQEIEIKIHLDDKQKVIDKIVELGGKKTYESLEQDIYFDNDAGFYDSGRVLRIRKEEKGTLFTYKEPLQGHANLLKREEIQTYVDDPVAIANIIDRLGFKEKYKKEKKVTYYELDGFQIEFHTVPFLGDFLEIEADEEKLKEFLPKIGLSLDLGVPKGYHTLFGEYLKNKGLASDIQFTFDEEKRINGQK